MRFSQRIGKRPIKTVLQIESMDDDLRNRLWNVILESFFYSYSDTQYATGSPRAIICKTLWKEFFKFRIDQIPTTRYIDRYTDTNVVDTDIVIENICTWFFKVEWYEVYDFIEAISNKPEMAEHFNQALKIEVSGYRIINGNVVQITSEQEVKEIEEAIDQTDKLKSVNTHLQSALDLVADRKNPDYRNSIKESISAVESICAIITGNTNTTLGQALSEIEKTHSLHKALKSSFSALYGYTSDAGGIRHSLLEDSITPTFEDAKFMLVSCSAFINYLKAKLDI